MSISDHNEGASSDQPVKVFLSYSRRNKPFMETLASALTAHGVLVDFDQAQEDPDNVSTGISASDEWWIRLEEMITSADVFVLLVSPASASSKVCDEELAFARNLGKKIIPLLVEPVDFGQVPPRLSALNVKFDFSDPEAFEDMLPDLVRAIRTDVNWHREGRKIAERRHDWLTNKRNASFLLRGAALQKAQRLTAVEVVDDVHPGHVDRRPGVVVQFPQPLIRLGDPADRPGQANFAQDNRSRAD